MTPAEAEEFQRWRAVPAHAEAIARHEKTWSLFERPAQSGQGAKLTREVHRRVARRLRRRMGAALGVATMLMMAGFVWRRAATTNPSPAATTVVLTPETRTLPDGSAVELKPGADLVVEFTHDFRRILLRRGQAHFQVAKDAARPFIVTASGVEVRAVGTAFAVELDHAAVAVLVTEGRVSVDRAIEPTASASLPNPPTTTPVPLRPLGAVDAGNRLVVELATASATPAVVPVSPRELTERLAWRATRLEFTGTRLAEAVALINRYNQVQLVIDDPALNDLEVSGFFRSDNMATFLHLIEQGLGVKSEIRGNTVGLRKADKPR